MKDIKNNNHNTWKRIRVFFMLYWKHILGFTIAAAILIFIVMYIHYSITGFNSMENFSKRQMAGTMALYLPMFLIVQIITLPFYFFMYKALWSGKGIGNLSAKNVDKDETEVKWDDVIGMEEAKKDAYEIVKLLKDHTMQKAVGGNIIKGTLMIGPPGCGKTYLAKAIASECGLPLISAVGSEFVAMFMGQGAERMKELFKRARAKAKLHGGCIIFIDEIDAFARPRNDTDGFGGNASVSHNATINQFLTEMDGLKKNENNIVVIAATNVEEEALDPAIMRSGRFDRKIRVEKPNSRDREELLKFYLKKVESEKDIDITYFADKAKWFSPSDINNMVREAGVIALRNKHEKITKEDLQTGLDRVMTSIEKMGGEKILSSKVNVKWDDVIGMENTKKEAWEIVELLKDRNKLQTVGGKIVKGMMMFGPPGCGKTYLAKAMATEAGFPFISKAGSEFTGIFVGEGTKSMKALFKEARRLARAEGGCIIFIDEIDSFARHRVQVSGYGGGISHNSTINQFLTEMDGLRQAENNIVVFAATNAREDELDSAIMRPGRFDRKIYVTRPNLKEREAIFNFYLKNVNSDDSCDAKILAQKTLYFTPSQIESMVRESGLFALRDKRDVITFKDLSAAYDRIMYGDKSNINMTEAEKEWVAYHEAGHAIIAYMCDTTNDVIKATIIPRKGSLGFVAQRPFEELFCPTKDQLLNSIRVCVAAYVAERLKYGMTSVGVGGSPSSDFGQAMHTAYQMVWQYGMGKSGLVGDFGFLTDYKGSLSISEKTKEKLDNDVQLILQECIRNVEDILKEKMDVLEYFAQQLMEKSELEYNEIIDIFKKFNIEPAAKRPKVTS